MDFFTFALRFFPPCINSSCSVVVPSRDGVVPSRDGVVPTRDGVLVPKRGGALALTSDSLFPKSDGVVDSSVSELKNDGLADSSFSELKNDGLADSSFSGSLDVVPSMEPTMEPTDAGINELKMAALSVPGGGGASAPSGK